MLGLFAAVPLDFGATSGTLTILGASAGYHLSQIPGEGVIFYGKFLTALVNFLIIAATLFVIIRSFEELEKRRRRGEIEVPDEEKSDEVLLLTEIRDLLSSRS